MLLVGMRLSLLLLLSLSWVDTLTLCRHQSYHPAMFSLLSLLCCIAFAILACAELRETIHTHLSYNFTLTAVNTTLKNANRTGSPLVLGQNGATSGEEFEVTSVCLLIFPLKIRFE